PFFLLISRKNSRIRRSPVSGSSAPKIAPTRSNTNGSHTSPSVGHVPSAFLGRSVTCNDFKTTSASSAVSANSGSSGTRLSPATIRSRQSRQAVDHSRGISVHQQWRWLARAEPPPDALCRFGLLLLLAFRRFGLAPALRDPLAEHPRLFAFEHLLEL